MKYFIVGDIHGCYDELTALIDSLFINKAEDVVIFVGDYFDRGPKSYEVWKYIDELKSKLKDRCVLLRGNHEQMLVDCYKYSDDTWFYNGHKATLNSFEANNVDIKDVMHWILNNTVYYYKNDLFTVVHAGRVADKVENDKIDTLIWDRACLRYADFDKDITFAGHTPLDFPIITLNFSGKKLEYDKPFNLPEKGMIGIDTACVYGYKLTAAIIDSDTRIVTLKNVESTQQKE